MKKTFIARNVLLICFLLCTGQILAQGQAGIRVQGNITDETGQPMPSVSVLVKSAGKTAQITATDTQGLYVVTANTEADSLLFSFVGYKTQSHLIGSRRLLNVSMEPDASALSEVVVTGYQTISRERATGSFEKVTSETLQRQRLSSLETVLQGQVAGLTNGLLRGTTSMNGMTSPLYVVDGFPIENTRYTSTGSIIEALPELNLEDIESITILKDAAATSIYGARAANGVVVIVTKKVVKGKPQIAFSSSFTHTPYSVYTGRLTDAADIVELEKEWAANNPNLQGANAATYANSLINNMVYTNPGTLAILNYHRGQLSQQALDSKLSELSSRGYGFYNEVKKYGKRNPFYQQYHLSIGQGTESNMFKTSITYKDNKHSNPHDQDNALGINITNSLNITSWLRVDIASYNQYKTGTTQTYDPASPGYKVLPYDRLVNADGSLFTSTADSRMSAANLGIIDQYGLYSMDITPLEEMHRNLGKTKAFNNRSYGKLYLKIAEWIDYNVMFQYEYGSESYNLLNEKESYKVRSLVNNFAGYTAANGFKYNLPYGHIYNTTQSTSNAYNFRQQVNVNKTFNKKHNITALAGMEVRHTKLEYNNKSLYNYDPSMLSFEMIDEKALANPVGVFWGGQLAARDVYYQYERSDRFVSIYGNAAYAYDSKYMFTGSLRWDRSNLWGTDSKYQNKPIWSVGAAWNIDRESFFNVNWVNRLKLRASHGIGGNISKNNAPYMTAYYSNNNNVGGMQGNISSRPNPLLTWEKTTTTNLGLDFALFKNRLNGFIEVYNKKGEDLLANTMGLPVEGWGYSTYTINNGKMLNRGIELSLSGSIVQTKDFNLSASAVYGYNKNEVVYVNVEAPVHYLQLDYPEAYPRIGLPYNSIYGYPWAGLSNKGFPQVYNAAGEATSTQPTNLQDIVYCGSKAPLHSGSLRLNLRYKQFELSALAIFQTGHKMRNTDLPFLNSSYSSAAGGYITNISAVNKDIVNRWRQPGDELHTDVPAALYAETPGFSSSLYTLYLNSSINVLNASNLRLSNISLAYNLPAHLAQKASIQHVRLQFNIENLCMLAANPTAKYLLGGYNKPSYVLGLHINF